MLINQRIFQLALTTLLIGLSEFSFSQLYINEFMASNSITIEDPDFQDNPDWIELYNAGESSINLSTYFITDNEDLPTKWALPDVEIISEGFIIIWADNEESGLHTNFKLSSEGEFIGLYSEESGFIDSIHFGLQQVDVSKGRISDGNTQFGFTLSPTPGTSNVSTSFEGTTYHEPEYNIVGGFYEGDQYIKITNARDGEIRYTTDGSVPTSTSTLFSDSIVIEKTTVIRSRVFETSLIPGPVITHTYFIGGDIKLKGLPVVSISSEPDNFWGPDGIYVQSFKPDWEIPINIEFFENDGSDRAGFNELAGTKINGLNSWALPQKMLGINFRKQYGENSVDYNLFPDNDRNSFKSFSLRASGSDWSSTLFRDILGQSLASDFMDIDIQKYRPSVVFINGEYMGIANIREKIDGDYIEENYNLPDDSFDIIENKTSVEEGSITNYAAFETLLNKDLSIESNYQAVKDQMSFENLTDYMILQTYDNNTSISHNVFSWKPKVGDQWKFILVDTDRGFFNPSLKLVDHYSNLPISPTSQLLENEEYQSYFSERFATQLYTTLNTTNVINQIDKHYNKIKDEVPFHIERWEGTTSSYGSAIASMDRWERNVGNLKYFAESRPFYLLENLSNIYGFNDPVSVAIGTYPNNAGEITFNDQSLYVSSWTGIYPEGLKATVVTNGNAGYDFLGWSLAVNNDLISYEDTWKYLDDGSSPSSDWNTITFDDASWDSGEGTDINGGSNTNYLRKSFTLNAETMEGISYLSLNMKRNDGAIVYLNGEEVIRSNMKEGEVTSSTSALNSESISRTYSYNIPLNLLNEGVNTIAVEVHQSSSADTDFQFDLELVAGTVDTDNIISLSPSFTSIISDTEGLIAVYEPSSSCFVPSQISSDLTLSKDCSPYILAGNLLVEENATLYIEPGVEIHISPEVQITVNGSVNAIGNESERIVFKINPLYEEQSWGSMNFVQTTDTSHLDYVTFEDASKGVNNITAPSAISAFNSNLELNHLIMLENYGNPIHARYSSVTLENSILHSPITGDLINVKYGSARVEDCEFIGNNQPDTDAIDYDDVKDGIIKNCVIYDFFGDNSDAIDIGEKAENIQIDSIWIINVTDKGVSVGQQSSAQVSNSTFVNCALGFGLKDSSNTTIDNCTFYNNGIPVSCFEKNVGKAGGNAVVTNSILSNSYDESYFVDEYSTLSIKGSISDNDTLPESGDNSFGDSEFESPTYFDFTTLNDSYGSSIMSINDAVTVPELRPNLVINNLFVKGEDSLEFISIYNPSSEDLDISSFEIDKGFTFVFPEGSEIAGGQTIFLTNYIDHEFWSDVFGEVYEWEEGRLDNSGEGIRLLNNYGITEDYIKYKNDGAWPEALFNNQYIKLDDINLDNHFGKNWSSDSLATLTDIDDAIINDGFSIYPNPTNAIVTVKRVNDNTSSNIAVYTTLGQLVDVIDFEEDEVTLDVSNYGTQLLILKIGAVSKRIVLVP